jgi:hypothetical protein
MRRFLFIPLALVVGGAYWAWDATHHDHDGPHGAPMTVKEIQAELTDGGSFVADDGGSATVTAADCSGDGDRVGRGFEHFRCALTFANGSTDSVVVHNLPTELIFSADDSAAD